MSDVFIGHTTVIIKVLTAYLSIMKTPEKVFDWLENDSKMIEKDRDEKHCFNSGNLNTGQFGIQMIKK